MGHIFSVENAFPFLPGIADAWIRRAKDEGVDVSIGHIIVPTRRAARSLSSAFLQATDRRALLLPQITPLSALDDVSLFFADGLRLLPAIRDTRRLALLAALVGARRGVGDRAIPPAAAWALAKDLARLVDEATRENVTLDSRIANLVDGGLAVHWEETVRFLDLVTDALPRIMRQQKALSPEERRVALMRAQAEAWKRSPTHNPVWLAGIAFASDALTDFARAVHELPHGGVILAGYDSKTGDREWDAVTRGVPHPSAGARRLLDTLGMARDDVIPLPVSMPARGAGALARSMFGSIADMIGSGPPPGGQEMLSLIQARDEHEEDRAIAAAIRHELETPGSTVAFVTPSREQATRVAAHLRAYGIHAEDSAGDPVLATPPGVFIRSVAAAVESGFPPVDLLAVLKNPFASIGGDPRETRRLARKLELDVIRTLHPAAGLSALAAATAENGSAELIAFVDHVVQAFAPLTVTDPDVRRPLPDLLEALLAATDALSGKGQTGLWEGESGAALSAALTALGHDVDELISVAPSEMASFIAEALADVSVRRPRNKDAHPRVAIWGVLESRLQHVDTVIVGGLVEGVFPAQADPGPWLSRPMRRAIGLPDPEMKIAEQAHDFQCLLSCARRTILASPARSKGTPAVPSRFLSRLVAVMGAIPAHPAPSWVRQTDVPRVRIQRPPPAPIPPLHARPRRYTISDVALLMSDPYALYAKRILKIRHVDSLAARPDASLFGDVVHKGYMTFLADTPSFDAPDASEKLYRALLSSLPPGRPTPGTTAWWQARLRRVAEWCVRHECSRIVQRGTPRMIALEVEGVWPLGNNLVVEGRADRIEIGADGTASVIDYKTGTVPPLARVADGAAPQLPVEAAMVRAGGFGPELCASVSELAYWKLSGGTTEGKVYPVFPEDPQRVQAVIEAAETQIPEILRHFADYETPFLDSPHPGRSPTVRHYDGVSRRMEWDVAG